MSTNRSGPAPNLVGSGNALVGRIADIPLLSTSTWPSARNTLSTTGEETCSSASCCKSSRNSAELTGDLRANASMTATFSVNDSLSSRSRLNASAKYGNAIAARRSRNAATANATASRSAKLAGRFCRGGAILSASVFKDIARSPNGVNQFAFEGIVQFFAKTADMHVHHIRVAVEVHIPDLLSNECAGENFARSAR